MFFIVLVLHLIMDFFKMCLFWFSMYNSSEVIAKVLYA